MSDFVRTFLQLFSAPFVWMMLIVSALTIAAGIHYWWWGRRHGPLTPTQQRALQDWARRITTIRWIAFALILMTILTLTYQGYREVAFLIMIGWVVITMLLRWLAAMLMQCGKGSTN